MDSAPTSSAVRAARYGSGIPTLLVDNVSGDHFTVRLNGLTLGTAGAGRSCLLVPMEVGDVVLEFVPVGMDPQLARPVQLGQSLHWRVEVGRRTTLGHDLFSLKPAASSCQTSSRIAPRLPWAALVE